MLAHVVAPSGGIEAALVDLVHALVDAGHDVLVYACRPFEKPNQNVDRLRQAGAVLKSCPPGLAKLAGIEEAGRLAGIDSLLWLMTPLLAPLAVLDALVRRRNFNRSLEGLHGKMRAWLFPRLRLVRLFYAPLDLRYLRCRPDVVHVHGWGCGIDPPGGLEWARARSFVVAYTEHNSPLPLAEDARRSPSWLNLADVLIACSNAGASGLRDVCCAEKPIFVIPYSVADPTLDTESDANGTRTDNDGTITITCLARLSVRHKGQDILLQAMKSLLVEFPYARLLLAGEGESRSALEAQAMDIGISEHVSFLGNVPRARLAWLMAESDIMVLPSNWEGLPVSVIESMAYGKPIVASDVGGNPELVADGESGFIVPARNVDSLAVALGRLVADPALRARMGAEARRRFEAGGFSPSAVAAATLGAYEDGGAGG